MSELGHCVVFWFAGLLAGVLLGWMLGRRAVGAAKRLASKPTIAVSLVVRDDYQNQGIGTEVLSYLTFLAKREGLLGFTAEVLMENKPMLHLFEKMGFDIQKTAAQGVYELRMAFRGK